MIFEFLKLNTVIEQTLFCNFNTKSSSLYIHERMSDFPSYFYFIFFFIDSINDCSDFSHQRLHMKFEKIAFLFWLSGKSYSSHDCYNMFFFPSLIDETFLFSSSSNMRSSLVDGKIKLSFWLLNSWFDFFLVKQELSRVIFSLGKWNLSTILTMTKAKTFRRFNVS